MNGTCVVCLVVGYAIERCFINDDERKILKKALQTCWTTPSLKKTNILNMKIAKKSWFAFFHVSLKLFYATKFSFDLHVSPKLQIDLYLFNYEINWRNQSKKL